jgi:hypothetical protein
MHRVSIDGGGAKASSTKVCSQFKIFGILKDLVG